MFSSIKTEEKLVKETRKYDFINVLRANLHEYCEHTTIHGVRYVGKGRLIKRIAWFLICSSLLVFCGTQIYKIILKWKETPLVFSLDQKYSPIKEIDFPAVTICPQTLPNRSKFNFSDRVMRLINDGNLTFRDDNEKRLFDAVTKICGKYLIKHKHKFTERLKNFPVFDAETTFDTLDENTLSHFMKLVFCKGVIHAKESWDCNFRFTKILIKQGVCYSFNLRPKNKIFRSNVHYPLADHPNVVVPDCNKDRKYVKEGFFNNCFEDNQTEQYTVKDRRDRLHVRTRFYDDFYDSICKPIPAVYIHSPYEIPWDYPSKGYGLDIAEFQRTAFSIQPVVIKTDDNLKDLYSSIERGCYFPDERPLRFFARYTQGNCELECLTNASLSNKAYNCTSYWMPRTDDIKPCDTKIFFAGNELEKLKLSDSCDCLPDCNSVEYRVKKTGSHTVFFDETPFLTKENDTKEGNTAITDIKHRLYVSQFKDFINFETKTNKTVERANVTPEFNIWDRKFMEIEVYYEDSKFLAMRRHLAYTFADFLSQIGGILGCFLGMSILSIIEFIYFCTVQMCRKPREEEQV